MTLSEDDIQSFIATTVIAPGVKYTLVLAAVTKKALAGQIPDEFRLQFLQHLEKMVDPQSWITADMITSVEPMDDRGYALFREASNVDPNKKLDMYAEIFMQLAVLNPSMITAIKSSPLYTRPQERVYV
jgi:hypothetical protein